MPLVLLMHCAHSIVDAESDQPQKFSHRALFSRYRPSFPW
jgi:hypothetical protein